MKKFRLETLLKMKKNRENEEACLLAALNNEKESLINRLVEKRLLISREEDFARKKSDPFYLMNAKNYIHELYSQERELEKSIRKIEKDIELQKEKVLKSMVERKKIEEFKKNMISRALREEKRAEDKNNAEFASYVFWGRINDRNN